MTVDEVTQQALDTWTELAREMFAERKQSLPRYFEKTVHSSKGYIPASVFYGLYGQKPEHILEAYEVKWEFNNGQIKTEVRELGKEEIIELTKKDPELKQTIPAE